MDAGVRISGLNSVRAILAFVVFFHHLPMWVFPPDHWLTHLFKFFTVGPAAVLAFFVVSGFCIHNGAARAFNTKTFYARRYVRITIPVLVATIGAVALDVTFLPWDGGVTWSLVCEELYYLVYPWIRNTVIPRWGVVVPVVVSFGVGYVALGVNAIGQPGIPSLLLLTVGYLPVWMLGFLLAETVKTANESLLARPSPFLWRTAVVFAAGLLSFAGERAPLVLPLFGLLFFLWLKNEIAHHTLRGNKFLENVGMGSYSLYLTHSIFLAGGLRLSHAFFSQNGMALLKEPLLLQGVVGVAIFLLTLGGTYLFYLMVEKPSHAYARSLELKTLSV